MISPEVFKSKNFYLLSSLIFYFLFSPFFIDNHLTNLIVTLLMSLTILICVNIISYNKTMIAMTVLLATLAFSSYLAIALIGQIRELYILHFAIFAFFILIMTIFVISSVASQHEITIDTLLGAICGYLLIGLTFSYIDLTITSINPDSFTYHMTDGTFRDKIQHFIYFSFTTLTTVGYGDIVPSTDIARAFAWLEAATGQIYLAVWISQLVAIHIAQRIRKSKGQGLP